MISAVYGINIAVKDLDAAVAKFEALLGVKSKSLAESDFAFPGMRGAMLNFNGVAFILITSTDEGSPAGKFLNNRGEGLMLISVESDDVDNDAGRVKSLGLKLAANKTMEGNYGKANWIHPKSLHGVQVEILEPDGVFKK